MTKGLIYCRVSTTEQAEEGLSLQAQERLCKEYATKHDIEVEKIFIERGESAKTINRTELQKMMKFCKLNQGKFDSLLIYKIDRLSRDSHDYGGLKIFFKGCGLEIISITEPIQDNPMGRFFETVLSANAQMDNEIRGDRTKMGMIEALKQGRYIFIAPYGYTNVGGRGNSNIQPISKLAPKIKQVFEEVIKGHRSKEEVRQFAKEIGVIKKDGKALAKSHFYKMLRNPVYKGYIDVPRMGIMQKGAFKAMIKPELFEAVQLTLDGKAKKLPIYKKIHPDFPLRGTIKCTCGKTMTSNWSKGLGGKYGYYRCSRCKGVNLKKKEVEDNFTNYLQEIKLKGEMIEVIKLAVSLNWDDRSKELTKKISELEKQKRVAKAQEDKIIDKNIAGVYSDSVAKRRLSDLEKTMAGINIELVRYKKPDQDEQELIEYGVTLLTNMSVGWQRMKPLQQDKFQKFVFPYGLVYKNQSFTTQEKPLTIQLNEMLEVENYSMVTPQRIELWLPG